MTDSSKQIVFDTQFIRPFIDATLKTLETQASFKCKPGHPTIKKSQHSDGTDIAGVISIVSKAFQGSIALCFPAKTFLAIYSQMVGEKHEQITQETEDAAAELLNIIFGQAKIILNSKNNYQIEKAIPTVLRGENLSLALLKGSTTVLIPFDSDQGAFHIEVSVQTSEVNLA